MSLVPEGERVILRLKPHPLFIVLVPLGVILLAAVLAWAAIWAAGALGAPVQSSRLWAAAALLIALRLGWQMLEWMARSYVLTERRIIRVGGVLRRYAADIPLSNLQHVTCFQTIRERVFGLGTLGFATAGTGAVEAYWVMVARPYERMQMVRDAAGGSTEPPSDVLTIGLAGAIGAGKSAVAAALRELGCVVSDSDAAAKAALERDDVRAKLVEWWGKGVLDDEGRVNRRAVADIVFKDEAQRRRLQDLTHPMVGQMRAAERKAASNARAFVIDAPLLFEAGVDAECDVVFFVDAPEDVRLQRLAETRGWSADEAARRQAAQAPLASKRERADVVIDNGGDRDAMRRQVKEALERIERSRRPGT